MNTQKMQWQPSYWLAALGAGGLSISFFMYLMWLVPHTETPVPVWEQIIPVLSGAALMPAGVRFVVWVAVCLMVLLALLHGVLLVWNIRAHAVAAKTPQYQQFLQSPSQVQLMTRPLTLTMTVNVCFAAGAVLVPGLWSIVEYIFPLALLAFILLGIWAIRLYGRYVSGLMVSGGYRSEEHNHLSPLIAVFAFSMLSVGFAAPAAMSQQAGLVAISSMLSILFLVLAAVVGLLVLVSGWQAMMEHGLQEQAAPSIWMLIPILTLLGIEWLRIQHGLSNHFQRPTDPSHLFLLLNAIFMLQLGVLVLGFRVMVLNGYFASQLSSGRGFSPVSFGLVCPGVAIVVLGMFWWHVGWVNTGVVTAHGVVYWLGIAAMAVVQFLTLAALLRLSQRLFFEHKAVIAA